VRDAGDPIMIGTTERCPWCDRPFGARQTGGRAQRFCREECRRNFHAAARRWALAELAAGRLTISALKNALSGNAHVALSGGRDDQRPGSPGPRVDCSGPPIELSTKC